MQTTSKKQFHSVFSSIGLDIDHTATEAGIKIKTDMDAFRLQLSEIIEAEDGPGLCAFAGFLTIAALQFRAYAEIHGLYASKQATPIHHASKGKFLTFAGLCLLDPTFHRVMAETTQACAEKVQHDMRLRIANGL